MIASLITAALLTQTRVDPVESFLSAFNARRADAPVESPDPSIAQAMEIAIQAVLNEGCVNSAQADGVLRPYRTAISQPGIVPYDHYSNIGCRIVSGDGLRTVALRMGAVTRWVIYNDATNRRLNLPSEFNWMFQSDVKAMSAPGGWVLECPAIVMETTRLPYRIIWLKRDSDSLSVTARFEAVWTRVNESSPVSLEGDLLSAKTLDTPKSFRVAPYVAAPARIFKWRIRNGAPSSRTEEVQHQSLRQIDAWMDRLFTTNQLDSDQQMFLADWPPFPMLRNMRTENGDTLLDFGATFRFRVTPSAVQYLGRSG
ncbi:MAG: hypothetical protein KF812_12805 [Fimbriimonadaceae bacterium]|nr:hypothetical protein [Fimbriimonadaceae bacterium]